MPCLDSVDGGGIVLRDGDERFLTGYDARYATGGGGGILIFGIDKRNRERIRREHQAKKYIG